jgi:hypothetical protein
MNSFTFSSQDSAIIFLFPERRKKYEFYEKYIDLVTTHFFVLFVSFFTKQKIKLNEEGSFVPHS